MARVTNNDVSQVYTDTQITDFTVFIETANELVNNLLSDKGLSDSLLTKIELYLAAHFAAISERFTEREKVGDIYVQTAGDFKMGLESTTYGQQAIVLDTSGTLKGYASGAKKGELHVL